MLPAGRGPVCPTERNRYDCGGCTEYVQFVDWLLGFHPTPPAWWGGAYGFDLAASPDDLDALRHDAHADGDHARLVAGYCWKWSDPRADGSLLDDVRIDTPAGPWTRPWNRKEAKARSYTPRNHPYTLWADTDDGRHQVGCTYSSQEFEFGHVGVIWGRDLVRRDDGWVAQREHCFDRPVKAKSADTPTLLRNADRVLLTRGIRRTRLPCLDDETREHIDRAFATVRAARPTSPTLGG